MPVMIGHAAIRVIRASPASRNMPTVALTASAFAEDRAWVTEAGYDDALTKPAQGDALFACVRRLLPIEFEHTRITPPTRQAGVADLGRLPKDVRQRLHAAALEPDAETAHSIARQREAEYPEVAAYILNEVDHYRFDAQRGSP